MAVKTWGYNPRIISQIIAAVAEILLTIHLFSGEMAYGTISSTEAIEIVFIF